MTTEQAPSAGTIAYRLEYLFSYSARLGEPVVIGPLPEGLRARFYVQDGQVQGPRLRGKLRPVGGDWPLARSDGVVR